MEMKESLSLRTASVRQIPIAHVHTQVGPHRSRKLFPERSEKAMQKRSKKLEYNPNIKGNGPTPLNIFV
jgi:hypothetical protein